MNATTKRPRYSRHFYVLVAKVLSENYTQMNAARMFANLFAEDNPNFDRKKFLHACGVR